MSRDVTGGPEATGPQPYWISARSAPTGVAATGAAVAVEDLVPGPRPTGEQRGGGD